MKRNYGIDFAKFLSMFMVVVLHNLLQGGVLSLNTITFNNMGYWLLENLANPAVNIFALASGFLMVDKEFRLSRITNLWFIVLFWSIVTTLIVMYLTQSWNLLELIKAFFPVILKHYWYFNAYIGVLLISPFINAGFKILKQQQISLLLSLILIISCTVGAIDNLFIEKGYSTIWLLIMYIAGAYLKKTKLNLSKIKPSFLIFIIIISTLLSLTGEIISIKYIGHIYAWLSYNSPFVVTQSFALFILLQKIKFKSTRIKKFLKAFTPLTFSVYLIDTNPIFFNWLFESFKFIRIQNLVIGYFTILIISFLLFTVCILLDFLRALLFKKITHMQLFTQDS